MDQTEEEWDRHHLEGNAALEPNRRSTDKEEEFKVHHRYLPIISGLACPFSVLLDVSETISPASIEQGRIAITFGS